MEDLISLLSSIAKKFLGYFLNRYNKKYIHDKKIAERSMKLFPEDIKILLVNHYYEGNYHLSHTRYIDGLIYFQEKQENHFFDETLNKELRNLIKKLDELTYFFAIHNDITQIPDVYKLAEWAIEKNAQQEVEKLTVGFEKAYEKYRNHLKKKFFI